MEVVFNVIPYVVFCYALSQAETNVAQGFLQKLWLRQKFSDSFSEKTLFNLFLKISLCVLNINAIYPILQL